ncbi:MULTISPECIES: hypothetical protein [Streptomyces]|uniref:hypothetical protein n=1 Tax=Streptomyces TaxID=1883 RepID=UPI00136948FD|nr:hypothetical protein [Streptomyces sp. SID2888]
MAAGPVSRGGRHSARCVEEAEETVKELRAALAEAGVILPSLRLDPVSLAREAPCPLVELGGCSVDVATRLTAALRAQRPAGA